MNEADQPLEAVRKVLLRHFPEADRQQIGECAHGVVDGFANASSLQRIERSNVPPSKDISDLRMAARHLSMAYNLLSRVGWHGGIELRPIAEQRLGEGRGRRLTPIVSALDAAELIGRDLDELRACLEEAAERVDPNAAPVFDYLGYGFKSGRAAETAALFTAFECANAFHVLSGMRPTRRTNWKNGRTYGPFLDLVRDMFKALGIEEAHVEHAARQAIDMEKRFKD